MKRILLIFSLSLLLIACSDDVPQSDIGTPDDIDSDIEITAPYQTITLDDSEDYVADGYIVADVREVDEYESGHIPDAINAPLSELEMGELGPLEEDEKYVIICRSGNRSATASDILADLGFDVVNVSEGMSTWQGDVEP